MFRRNPQEKPLSFRDLFAAYVCCPEAAPLALVYFIGSCIAYKAWRDAAFRGNLLGYAHIWGPPASTLLVNSIGSYLGRCGENRRMSREQTMRFNEQQQAIMEQHRQEGLAALKVRRFQQALDNFKVTREIYQSFYHHDSRVRAKQLFLECIFNEALTLYYLKREKEAQLFIEGILKKRKPGETLYGYVQLLNLNAVLLLHAGKEDEAKACLIASYQIDQTQNNVYCLLRFLAKDYCFIAKNIPLPPFEPLIDLSVTENSFLRDQVVKCCTTACMKEGKFAHVILLHEKYNLDPTVLTTNPSHFFELAELNLQCAEAYLKLIAAAGADRFISLLKISEANTSESLEQEMGLEDEVTFVGASADPTMMEEQIESPSNFSTQAPLLESARCSIDTARSFALRRLQAVKSYLEAELFLQSAVEEKKLARQRCGLLFGDLVDVIKKFPEINSQFDLKALQESAIKHLEEAQTLQKNLTGAEDRVLREVIDSLSGSLSASFRRR